MKRKKMPENFQVISESKKKNLINRYTARIKSIIDELSLLSKEKDEESLIRLSELTQERDRLLLQLEEVTNSRQISQNLSTDRVALGSRVKLKNRNQNLKILLVGSYEVDSAQKEISVSSPLGSKLLNRKKGETVEVNTPAGLQSYEILHIG